MGRADNAIDTSLTCQIGEQNDLVRRRAPDAYLKEARVVRAGQNGHSENRRRAHPSRCCGGAGRLDRGGHHGHTARGVDREHARPQSGQCRRRARDLVWNVVQLQVDEHVEAHLPQRVNY